MFHSTPGWARDGHRAVTATAFWERMPLGLPSTASLGLGKGAAIHDRVLAKCDKPPRPQQFRILLRGACLDI